MKAQFYTNIHICRLFNNDEHIADIHSTNLEKADRLLKLLGWRRNERWQKRNMWGGYEANLKRIK